MTRIEDERAFFDRQYAPFLALPEEALAVSRATFEADLDNPRRAVYERRRLFQMALERALRLPRGHALEYGCGTGDWGLLLATEGWRASLIDVSPAAIEVVRRRARASNVEVNAVACEAANLAIFGDGEFDLIFASAALHHTLKYPNAIEELVRVLRKGGVLLLAETYGNNAALNTLRRLRARLTRQPAEQGEEIVLSDRELARLRTHFEGMELRPVNLLAMAKRLFRGRFHWSGVPSFIGTLEAADRALLKVAPALERYCGEVLVEAVK